MNFKKKMYTMKRGQLLGQKTVNCGQKPVTMKYFIEKSAFILSV